MKVSTSILLRFAMAGAALWVMGPDASAQKSKDTVRLTDSAPIVGVLNYMNPSGENVFTQETVFDDLISFDDKALKLVPLLATAWRRIDNLTVEFDLRDDVKWHDGEKFSADDVVYTLSWLSNPDSKLRSRLWDWIEKVEKLSPTKVRLVSKEPTPTAIVRLAAFSEMLPKHVLEKGMDINAFNVAPVGTGMYKAVNVDRNRGFFFERNDNFRHGGSAKPIDGTIKSAQMLFVPDEGARIAQFLAGDLDVIRDVDYDQAKDLAKTPNGAMTMVDYWGHNYLVLDATGKSGSKPLEDVRVRRALLMSVDREELRKLRSGDFQPQNKLEGMCFRFQEGCDYTAYPPPYDPAGAKKLLAEAGYPNGFELELSAVNTYRTVAVYVINEFAKIGVKANVDILTGTTFAKKWADGKIQVGLNFYGAGGMPDVIGVVQYMFDSPNRDSNGDPQVKDLARIIGTEMDPAKRLDAGRKIYSLANEKAYVVPIAATPIPFVHSKDLKITGGAMHGYAVHMWNFKWN